MKCGGREYVEIVIGMVNERDESKTWKDLYARRCTDCGNWNLLREDWLKCVNCAHPMTKEVATIRNVDANGILRDPYAETV